jgi:hypothetical protein
MFESQAQARQGRTERSVLGTRAREDTVWRRLSDISADLLADLVIALALEAFDELDTAL